MNKIAAIIRDSYVLNLQLSYDWRGAHHAKLTFQNNQGIFSLLFSDVRAVNLFEDFGAQYIELCKVLDLDDGIYVSLDPYDENSPMVDERDNYCITANAVELKIEAQLQVQRSAAPQLTP